MNGPAHRARRERHLRDRSPGLITRFLERREQNPRYQKWLKRNGLEDGYQDRDSGQPGCINAEPGIKPDPVKAEQVIKREAGLYMEQALQEMQW